MKFSGDVPCKQVLLHQDMEGLLQGVGELMQEKLRAGYRKVEDWLWDTRFSGCDRDLQFFIKHDKINN